MTEHPRESGDAVPEWDVADRMRKALRHAGIGVQQMADYLDVDRSTVSTWINGRIRPGTQTMRLWALRCGVDYGWLSGTSDPRGRVLMTAGRGLNKLGFHAIGPDMVLAA